MLNVLSIISSISKKSYYIWALDDKIMYVRGCIMKIAIIDDDLNFCQNLKNNIMTHYQFSDFSVDIYDRILSEIYTKEYDIVFLDVLLEDGKSFDKGRQIKDLIPQTIIVYMSIYEQFVYDSYKEDSFFFIRKSNIDNDLDDVFEKFKKLYLEKQKMVNIVLNGQTINIPEEKILFIESQKNTNKIIIHLLNESFEVYSSLKSFLKKLDSHNFYKLNSYIVINLNHLESIEKDSLYLINGQEIRFTRGSKVGLLEAYYQFKRGKL